jgi:hypothetical protein
VTSLRRIVPTTACALALALLSGCAGQGNAEDDNARAAALRFAASVSGDVATACGLLAPQTLQTLEETDGDCATGLRAEGPTDPGAVRSVDVYGKDAIVHLSGDTLFLARFADGWRVTAAGCTARPDRPYDCTIEGN